MMSIEFETLEMKNVPYKCRMHESINVIVRWLNDIPLITKFTSLTHHHTPHHSRAQHVGHVASFLFRYLMVRLFRLNSVCPAAIFQNQMLNRNGRKFFISVAKCVSFHFIHKSHRYFFSLAFLLQLLLQVQFIWNMCFSLSLSAPLLACLFTSFCSNSKSCRWICRGYNNINCKQWRE